MGGMWNLPAPPGFRGFDPSGRVRIYQRHLPHWRQEGATYFVTCRLSDSLPRQRLRELAGIQAQWQQQAGEQSSDEQREQLARTLMERIERWLDLGAGSCLLATPHAAEVVGEALRHFHNHRYELGCYVIMPNHVHVIVRPFDDEVCPLERILQSWKSYTSRQLPRPNTCQARLWQQESFDRIIRDEEHLYRCVQYIGSNPTRAELADGYALWMNPDWESAGWRFDR